MFSSKSIGTLLSVNDEHIPTDADNAEQFNNYISSVCNCVQWKLVHNSIFIVVY